MIWIRTTLTSSARKMNFVSWKMLECTIGVKVTISHGAVSDSSDVNGGDIDTSLFLESPAQKWPRTAKHLVNSIDAAIDDDNHQPLEFVDTLWRTCMAKFGHAKDKKARIISWTNRSPNHRGRQRLCHTPQEKYDLHTAEAKACSLLHNTFDLFIMPAMIDLVMLSI